MRKTFVRRGQSLVDLALIIGVAGLVFVGMQTYVKRGVQGKVKDLTDAIISEKQSGGDAPGRTSDLTADSTLVTNSFVGGGRRLTGTEDTVSHYSQSQ